MGEEHGFGEGADWEIILAGCDGALAGASKDGVDADGVDLFLLQAISVGEWWVRGEVTHSYNGRE